VINGAHSGVAVLVLVAVMAVRLIGSQRRRPMGRPGTRGFAPAPGRRDRSVPTAGDHPSVTPSAGTGAAGLGGTEPGWFRDPFVRHDQRYWSGSAWTEHVQDQGVPGVDPPPPPRDRAA
jgi:hypothetical protein